MNVIKKKVGAIATSVAAIAVCSSIIAGSTFALFTSETKTDIAITSAKVDVTATIGEITATGLNGKAMVDAKVEGGNVSLDNIAPGDTVNFNITVENRSTIQVQYRTKISCTEGEELMSALVFNVGEKDYSGLVSYVSEWSSWDEAGSYVIPVEIALPEDAGNEYQALSCKVSYAVEAVQGNGSTVNESKLVKTKAGNSTEFVSALNYVRSNGGTITLTDDITLNKLSKDYIIISKDVKFNLAGHKLTTAENAYLYISSGGHLTVENGELDMPQASLGNAAVEVKTGSSLTLDGVTLNTNAYGLYPSGDAAQVNVLNSTIKSVAPAVSTNAGKTDNYHVQINIENSTIESDYAGLLINVPCVTNIVGSTINGAYQGAILRGGDVTATDTTFSAKGLIVDANGDGVHDYHDKWLTGTAVSAGGLVIGNNTSNAYQYKTTVTLYNTTATAENGVYTVYMHGNAKADIGATLYYDAACSLGEIVQGGGCTAAYQIADVATAEEVVAAFDEVGANGGMVRLTEDVEINNYKIVLNADAVVDLNGHAITKNVSVNGGDHLFTVAYGANVTIKNGAILDDHSDAEAKPWGYAIYNNGSLVLEDMRMESWKNTSSLICNFSNAEDKVATLTINGGEYIGHDMITLKCDRWSETYINGGTIQTNKNNNILCYGKLVIEDGKFISTAGDKVALVISSGSYKDADYKSDVTINGGNFDGIIRVLNGYGFTSTLPGNTNVTINGGNFSGALYTSFDGYSKCAEDTITIAAGVNLEVVE